MNNGHLDALMVPESKLEDHFPDRKFLSQD